MIRRVNLGLIFVRVELDSIGKSQEFELIDDNAFVQLS